MTHTFTKRTYRPGLVAQDVTYLIRHLRRAHRLLKGNEVSSAFRERLMLVVTGVNRCRYCRAAHTSLGHLAGLTDAEIEHLLGGEFLGSPAHEHAALLYARFWAETNGVVDPSHQEGLAATYGKTTAGLIDYCLRAIRLGNLTGNTLDWVLYTVSRGRLGGQTIT